MPTVRRTCDKITILRHQERHNASEVVACPCLPGKRRAFSQLSESAKCTHRHGQELKCQTDTFIEILHTGEATPLQVRLDLVVDLVPCKEMISTTQVSGILAQEHIPRAWP